MLGVFDCARNARAIPFSRSCSSFSRVGWGNMFVGVCGVILAGSQVFVNQRLDLRLRRLLPPVFENCIDISERAGPLDCRPAHRRYPLVPDHKSGSDSKVPEHSGIPALCRQDIPEYPPPFFPHGGQYGGLVSAIFADPNRFDGGRA